MFKINISQFKLKKGNHKIYISNYLFILINYGLMNGKKGTLILRPGEQRAFWCLSRSHTTGTFLRLDKENEFIYYTNSGQYIEIVNNNSP